LKQQPRQRRCVRKLKRTVGPPLAERVPAKEPRGIRKFKRTVTAPLLYSPVLVLCLPFIPSAANIGARFGSHGLRHTAGYAASREFVTPVRRWWAKMYVEGIGEQTDTQASKVGRGRSRKNQAL
jgi:hypothetical protein